LTDVTDSTNSVPDDVSITVGHQTLAGWMSIRITRSLEQMPSTFDISATEMAPLQQGQFLAKPGDALNAKSECHAAAD
jgi:prophage tail gpP-like protein